MVRLRHGDGNHSIPVYRGFDDSQRSPYRQRLVALSTPISEPIQNVMRLGYHLYEFGFSHGIFDDSHSTRPSKSSLMAYLHSFFDDAQLELLIPDKLLRKPNLTFVELYRELFTKNDLFMFLNRREGFLIGPTVFSKPLHGTQVVVGAFGKNSGSGSVWIPSTQYGNHGVLYDQMMVLDAVHLFESAVYPINLFRFHEFENCASSVMAPSEVPGGIPKQVLADRLVELLGVTDSHVGPNLGRDPSSSLIAGVLNVYREESPEVAITTPNYMLGQRFLGLAVHKYYHEDDVEHTMALANAVARSHLVYYITHSFLHPEFTLRPGLRPEQLEYAESISKLLSHLFDIAYGETELRLNALILGHITQGFDRNTSMMVYEMVLDPLMRGACARVGLSPNPDHTAAFLSLLTIKPEVFRSVARELIDSAWGNIFGHPSNLLRTGIESAITDANRMAPFTHSNLPTVVEMWNRRYEPFFVSEMS